MVQPLVMRVVRRRRLYKRDASPQRALNIPPKERRASFQVVASSNPFLWCARASACGHQDNRIFMSQTPLVMRVVRRRRLYKRDASPQRALNIPPKERRITASLSCMICTKGNQFGPARTSGKKGGARSRGVGSTSGHASREETASL
jgi:hypothetical protein